MKKIVSIFLLLQILTNNTFAEEVVKVPRLFAHFNHHTHEHQDTKNFIDFLNKHYSGHHEHSRKQHDDDNDCELPFKHCGNCVNNHVPVIANIPPFVQSGNTGVPVETTDFTIEDDRIESLTLTSIWQPPKLSL